MTAWWMHAIWTASTRGGAALLLALVFSLVPRVPAMVRCWGWRAAYGVLLVSFVWTTPVSLPLRSAIVSPNARVDAGVFVGSATPTSTVPFHSGNFNPVEVSNVSQVADIPRKPASLINWAGIGMGLWAALLFAYAVRLFLNWRSARQLQRGPLVFAKELAELCHSMGIRHAPLLRTHLSVQGPLLIGLRRPSIVLPEWALSSPELPSILAHELAHLKRRDLLWNWLPALSQAVLPVHPLVWICNRRWRLATESACDAAAVCVTAIEPANYARVLVHASSFQSQQRHGVLSVAVAADSRWLLKQRITLMQKITFWNHRRLVVVGLTVAVSGVIASVPWRVVAQSAPTSKPSQAVVQVPASQPATSIAAPAQPGPRILKFSGTVIAKIDSLRASASGTVNKVAVVVGQAVKRGEVLVQLDETLAQLEVKEAKSKVDYAATELARKNELIGRGAASVTERELADSQWELAKSELERANFELERTRVVSPFDGTISACDVEPGDAIEDHQQLVSVVQSGPLQIQVNVPQAYCGLIKLGAPVVISYQAGAKFVKADAQVKTLAPVIDRGSGTRGITIQVTDAAPDLLPGMIVEVPLPAIDLPGSFPSR